MDRRSRLRLVPCLIVAFLAASSALQAEGADPTSLRRDIEASRLDVSRAVALKGTQLNAGLATLRLDDGVLLPTTGVGGKTVEMVFVGKGRIVLDPPDAIEAGQLELFTQGTRLEEPFTEMVLVLGLDAAVDAMLHKPKTEPDPALVQRATGVYAKWKASPERKLLGVDAAILTDAAGDAPSQGYFAAWLRGSELGDFLYVVDPDTVEQVILGHFVPLEATEKERRKILKQINREQRNGRLIGLELEDLGQWDTWLSSSLRGKDGKPLRGNAAFEPLKYTLEVGLAGSDLHLTGKARIDLKPVLRGARAVSLSLNGDLQVSRVTDGAGVSLFFDRAQSDLTVLLPGVPPADAITTVVVEYSGKMIEKQGSTYALEDTYGWYPHAGTIDRAVYDVTFRWPRKLDLVSCGRRVKGGEETDGTRWEQRVFDIPAAAFTFEVGRYKIETAQAGHVQVRLAFDPEGKNLLDREGREEIKKAATDSLQYFEDLFGPYPLDELTVVNVPRDFSQSTLGFVTLSTLMMFDLDVWNLVFQLEDRRTVIAHEISHQWWGHQVGWSNYRDQWISEAMANYSALLYSRNRLDKKEQDEFDLGPTNGWQDSLTDTTEDGRAIESLGPVVLGSRLFSSRSSSGAYQAIVYQKGAVVLDMLARSLGEKNFPKVLQQIVKVTANRPISTEDFLSLIERITTADLDAFADQYIYGTGLPEVYYTYRLGPKAAGKWVIQGEARLQTPYRFHYRVVKTAQGSFDVARERLDQIASVKTSILVVPFQADIYDPGRDDRGDGKKNRKGEKAANATLRGTLVLNGESTPFSIESEYEPKEFWLDRDEAVFGRFFNESREPKRMLFFQGLDAAAAGKAADAEALFLRALAAEVEVSTAAAEAKRIERDLLKRTGRQLDAEIELSRARLFLEQGQDAQSQEALDRAHRVLGTYGGWVEEELKVLQSRLEMRRGLYEKAYKRLRKGLLGGGDLDSTEGYVLLAIAAQATGNKEDLDKAVKIAKENGADLALLNGGR